MNTATISSSFRLGFLLACCSSRAFVPPSLASSMFFSLLRSPVVCNHGLFLLDDFALSAFDERVGKDRTTGAPSRKEMEKGVKGKSLIVLLGVKFVPSRRLLPQSHAVDPTAQPGAEQERARQLAVERVRLDRRRRQAVAEHDGDQGSNLRRGERSSKEEGRTVSWCRSHYLTGYENSRGDAPRR